MTQPLGDAAAEKMNKILSPGKGVRLGKHVITNGHLYCTLEFFI